MEKENAIIAFLFVIIFGYAVEAASGYPPEARVIPLVAAIPGLALAFFNLYRSFRRKEKSMKSSWREEAGMVIWIAALIFLVWIFGFLISLPLFLLSFLRRRSRESWRVTLMETGIILLAVYFLFYRILHIPLNSGLLIDFWERLGNA